MNPLTQTVIKLKQHPDHRRSILQLYKELLRKSHKLNTLNVPNASILIEELKIGMYEGFTKNYTNVYQITQALLKGVFINDALDDAIFYGNHDKLMQCVDQHRKEYFEWAQRRTSYLRNHKELEDKRIGLLRGRESTLATSRKKGKSKQKEPDLSIDRNINQFVSKGLETATRNGQSLILRYLNQLQYAGKIPNPHLLSYTPETLQTNGDHYNSHHIIKGSTQKIINQSFDREYIESIMIPALEFDLNDMNMEKTTAIVNKKGPYQATAKENKSGTIALPYILSPFKHKPGRKEIAHLIRQQVLWSRIQKVWETTHELEEENMGKDGSYPIRGSRGFGVEESMKPRVYYEELAVGEEMFLLFCEIEQRKLSGMDVNEEIDFEEFNWTKDLDLVSEALAAKYSSILQESKLDLTELQSSLQHRFDEGFESKVERFTCLLAQLREQRVFKHSEIVAPPKLITLKDELPNLSVEKFPMEDRIGRGKTLADFLKQYNFPYFEFGHELRKKVNEIMAKIVHKF
ncbi:hypothetical protein I9W82_001596 [Candida metapsilosis]|uniref:Uncharacterized protein n=1 Tax=Candida metapsilosis TaxID=273372 RepID=A0A8H7ZIV8_9ASCO|nr:hypothetical protein I9W82_001596 [Candida metapsilosis]